MTFLPIVDRELRVAARKAPTYWVRTGAGLLVMALGTGLFLMLQGQPQSEIALSLFYLLSGAAVFYSLMGGIRTTADSLSEEKREGALGLLFLTDLRGIDVVLGKLVANSVHAFYGVLAILPMIGVPMLLGGITAGEYGRMGLLVVNSLFFSLAVGMAVSALSQKAQRAILTSMAVVLIFHAGLPLLGAILNAAGKTRTVSPVFLMPSAGFTFYAGTDAAHKLDPDSYWISMGVIHGLGWVFLVLASFIAPRTWQERPRSLAQQTWRERWKRLTYGDSIERTAFRRSALDINAYYWLCSRERLKAALVWGFLAVIACAWVWGLAKARAAWLEPGVFVSTALLLNGVLRCWIVSEATRQLAEDGKQGTLELLLSTPLSVRDILAGQRIALTRQFSGPIIVVLLAELGFMLATIYDQYGPDARFTLFLYLAGMSMFVMDAIALYWVGMWLALVSRNQSRAISTSLSRILLLPWVLLGLLTLLMVFFPARINSEPGDTFFLASWFFIGLAVDVFFAFTAKRRLLQEFRTVAQQRFAGTLGFWKRLLMRR